MAPHSSTLAWETPWTEEPGGIQSLGREDPLEKEMAIHSSTLAWETPWTEEPGGLYCIKLQTVGHNSGLNNSNGIKLPDLLEIINLVMIG